MKNTLILTRYTLHEAFARKNFIAFFAVSTLVILIILGIFATTDISGFEGVVKMNGENIDLSTKIVEFFRLIIVMPLFGGGLFLSIFSVSSFIPQMLEKGNIDVLLSKPVSRAQLIWGKFWGGMLVVLLNVAYLVFAIWILIGMKFGNWDASFLMTILSITFTFSVLYSLIIIVGVLTQSSVLAMMLSYLIFFIFSPLLLARDKIAMLVDSKIVQSLLDWLYYIIPKTSELGNITKDLAAGNGIADYQPIITSFIFMILILFSAIIIFNKKDY